MGLGTLAVVVGEEAGTLEDVYEPFLIQEGFLKRTARGREATPLAYEHLGLAVPAGAGDSPPRGVRRASSAARPAAARAGQPELPLS